MKILVTSLPDLPKINPQRPHHLLHYLSKKHDVTLLCINAWWLKEQDNYFLNNTLNDINIKYFSKKELNPVIQEILSRRDLNQLNIDLDSFDVHINFNSLIAGYNISRKIEAPTVFDIFDDLVDWIAISPRIPNLMRPIGKKIGSIMVNRNINVSNRVTCSLEFLRNLYEIPENKTDIIPNGVDINLFRNVNGQSIREKLNIHEDTFLLVFIGFLGNWIDLEPAFHAIKQLRGVCNIKMLVVGDGDNLDKFKNLSKILGIESLIIFTGNVNYSKVPEYISAADACLMPFNNSDVSKGALPLKLFEYMACEKPVISSPLVNVKNIVGDRVIFADNTKLKDKILDIYKDETTRDILGKKGRDFVRKNYSWDSICTNFEKTLINVVGED